MDADITMAAMNVQQKAIRLMIRTTYVKNAMIPAHSRF
jgi:hypothetical protein